MTIKDPLFNPPSADLRWSQQDVSFVTGAELRIKNTILTDEEKVFVLSTKAGGHGLNL